MRILCVNQDRGISPGRAKGAAIHLEAMRSAFRALGADVVCLDEADDERLGSALESAHAEAPFDMVHERYALGKTHACRFAQRQGIPHVLEVNAPLLEESSRYRDRAMQSQHDVELEAWLFSNSSHVVTVSTELARYVRERGGGGTQVRVFPNGVDSGLFRPREDDSLRHELVPQGRLVVGFHGRLRPWHGIELLALAARELLDRSLPIHVLTIGNGEYEEALADHVPVEHRTHVPWIPHTEVAAHVACFDTLPITYGPDTPTYFSPLKLAESMACGAVPVVPDVGDLARIVEHGRSGLVYRVGDLEQLVTSLELLASDPEVRARLSRGALESAEGRTWTAIATDVVKLAGIGVTP